LTFRFESKRENVTVNSSPVLEKSTIGTSAGLVGLMKRTAVVTRPIRFTVKGLPPACATTSCEVMVSGNTSEAASPEVLLATAGIFGLKRILNVLLCLGASTTGLVTADSVPLALTATTLKNVLSLVCVIL